ncbi:F-box/WD-40 repeat-containing protein At5g21040 [Phoenix dactylifera]|uniref:F-box/WD-40 repeat-containing protein At5g21040 n=1 Tax=Phoenix dactylifera TaxID=42345 RepID=A0A8B8J842_PHODC|nr:F-box/WD-40 repeat-containing protein At5g21040 [Phoenix dactylifera]XP_038974226.1 F-box/WD-40 repeat-containing protein At5g21040 [Phoenix dactylifera]
MALECQEVGEASPKNSFSNPWGKEITRPSTRDYFPSASSNPNSNKKSPNKSVIPKLVCGLPSKKAETKSGSKGTDHASPNGDHRSFTDLPSALVSEILRRLDAKELGIVSCVSPLLHSLASDHQGWRDFYCNRWGPPLDLNAPPVSGSPNQKSWKELFVEREFRSKSFMGRFSIDALHGHTEAVRAVFLLRSAKLIFTGGYDSVIRMWDMEEGFSIAVSRPLGCTIRAIAADSGLLVAGGTDAFLQCWRAIEGNPHLFNITGSTMNQNYDFRLWGHEGPVTCLALDSARIYSGSWDMSVRVWDRARLKCLRTLRHGDWVWALAPRGGTIASTAGKDVYVWDIEHGDPITVISNAHVGNAHCLARSHLGDLLFTGGEDGVVHMFEITENCDDEDIGPAATWIPHTGPVHSLAFEFPWLVSSSSDGRLALIDVRKLLKSSQCSLSRQCVRVKQSAPDVVEPPQRMLHGFGCNLFSVDIGADRIVCGGEEGVVRVWNFSQALEIERRVQALRSIRQENRMRRRKAQIEMNGNTGRTDQCSVAAKRNQLNGDRNGIWHSKRGVSGKLKA